MSYTTWALVAGLPLILPIVSSAQTYYYRATDATGRLARTAVTNVSEVAARGGFLMRSFGASKSSTPDFRRTVVPPRTPTNRTIGLRTLASPMSVASTSLVVSPVSASFDFLGLTHYDQRNANNGNQFSVEPPSPDIAAANGWVLEGVNNAIQVYSGTGAPLLAKALSTNELFALPPAIDRITDINGVFPTDMRVFYDHDINRWFVLERAQDNDIYGNMLPSSHLYLAVSQTGDPTGSYNIYTMNTTNAGRFGCPCFSDFPQIASDKYGVYISVDEYDIPPNRLVDVSILAISKSALAAGSPSPRMQEFVIPRLTGYEATVRPAITPPGASYALSGGGIQFFLSTQSLSYSDSNFALWALTNTASLNTTPDLTLIQSIIPSLPYTFPDVAVQKPGPLPYGSTLIPPGQLAFIDGGRDCRILSLVYAAGRLYATFAAKAADDTGRSVVAGGYAILYPAIRGTLLAAPVWRQGYIVVRNNHVLRPAVAVTAQGKGAIAFTLVGPDYYPSAAFLRVDGFVPGTTVEIAEPGVAPEDGFTGYPDNGFVTTGLARWGDYSGASVAPDGSIWMTIEYIPGAPRTDYANWGTRIIHYQR